MVMGSVYSKEITVSLGRRTEFLQLMAERDALGALSSL